MTTAGRTGRPTAEVECARCGGLDATARCPQCGAAHHGRCLAGADGCADPWCPSHRPGVDTPPLGLPVQEERVIAPVVIQRGTGWVWTAGIAGVVALAAAATLLLVLLGDDGGGAAETALVPQVTDFPWQEARQILDEAGFVPVHEGVHTSDGVDGAVLAQDPPANSRARLGSFVEIRYAIVPEPTATPAEGGAAADPTARLPTPATPTPATPTPATATTATPTTATPTPPGPTPETPGTGPAQLGPALDPPWVAIVASPSSEAQARRLFEDRYAEDHPRGGVLESARYPGMRAGVWVVYLDHFPTRAEAEAFCRDRVPDREPGGDPPCYARTTDVTR